MRIYVASSWRNNRQPSVVQALRAAGHEVYDFRHPAEGNNGFHWSDIDPDWKSWSPAAYREALAHPVAEAGFNNDFRAMQWADAFVLVQPCGRSAHLELGWAVGANKPTCILLADGEPELMVKMVDRITLDLDEVIAWLQECVNCREYEAHLNQQDIHLTEQDCLRFRQAVDADDLSDVQACTQAVVTFRDRERWGWSLRGAAVALLRALFQSRRRAMRLEKYILQQAKEHDFDPSDVLYGEML